MRAEQIYSNTHLWSLLSTCTEDHICINLLSVEAARDSLVATSEAEGRIRSSVRQLETLRPLSQKNQSKQKQYCNKFKTLKMVHMKIFRKKRKQETEADGAPPQIETCW